MGMTLTPEERFEVFGDTDPTQYAAEVEERWGDTDAYRQSYARTRSYTKTDWLAIKAESASIEQSLIEAMTSGAAADSEPAMHAAERHRQHITARFYDCSHDASGPGRNVRLRPEVHGGLRTGGRRAGPIPPRRDRGERHPRLFSMIRKA